MRLATRAFWWMVGAFLIVILMTAAALFLDLRRSQRDATLDRLTVTAGELRLGIEARLNFGQPLPLLIEAQALIDGARGALLGQGSIEVVGPGGRILRATDRLRIGETAPEAWLAPEATLPRQVWRRAVEGGYAVGVPILDGLGAAVGMVVVMESDARSEVRAAEILEGVTLAGGVLLVLLLPAAYFGTRILLDPVGRAASLLSKGAIELRRADIDGGAMPVPPESADPTAKAYLLKASAALIGIAAGSSALENLDEGA
ncbi:hypothetical protein ACFSM5_15180 [Lacibacterium aquatile]|uniref:Sensor histidine kinase n=1 Tax=Lacibacterium aquatile TaxID=1168082 RepID=A0ABW5DTJ3_9PROT